MATENAATGITWWAIVSAFGGAVIGGGISYLLARMNLTAAKKQRDVDRFEVRKAQAFSLFFKMIRIHSTIVLLGKGNIESIARAEAAGVKDELWQKILAHGNLPPRVKFAAEEMALILSLDDKLFNEVAPYDDIHNSLLDLFTLYGQRRDAMTERFGAKMQGDFGISTFTQEEFDWIAPRAHELNNIAKTMLQRTADDSKESRELLTRLHALFVKEFGLSPKLEFKDAP